MTMTRLRALLGDRRGATALAFGLAALPLIAIVALAIDFGGASSAKARLDLAADAGALATVMSASNVFATNPLAPLDPAIADGQKRFNAQAGRIGGVVVQPVQVQVTRDGTTFTAAVSYNATFATAFAGVVGASSIPIGGTAQALLTTGPYVDVQVLLDVSSSMLIAATPADITAMLKYSIKNDLGQNFANPASSWWPSGCSFACHWDPNNNDFYRASRLHNITLRLDQLISAVTDMATTINTRNTLSQYRFGLYTFSKDVASNYPLSAAVAGALPVIAAVAPPLGDYNAPYETNITESITHFAANDLSQAGDGSSASKPKKFVFLLTDGVEDVYSPGRPSNRIESAVNPAACAAMKAKGVTVAVLHTIYYNPNNEYSEITAIQDSVTQALQQCASGPDLYFAVSDQNQIDAAMQAMLNVAIAAPARFTR
jgi:Flp pilus assembly protein TadG